jgi:hypothetical protein
MSMSRLRHQDVNKYLYMDLKDKLQSKFQKSLASLTLDFTFNLCPEIPVEVKVDFHLAQKTWLPKAQNIETI